MTSEKRIVIEVKDILGFEFECTKCGGRLYIPIDKFDSAKAICANCREQWFVQNGPDHIFVQELLQNLKRLAKPITPLAVTVRFQVSPEVEN